jgi:DNA repair protein RadC
MAEGDRPGPSPTEAKPHYHGHRRRLRERFLRAGAEALADYELLELLLFLAHPRGDVKPLAKRLIEHFGSFADTIAADQAALRRIEGIGETSIAALKTAEAAALRLIRQRVLDKPVIGSWQQLIDYCRASMAALKIEQFRVLFLDRKNRLLADELQQRGTVDHTPVYPREVVKRALELSASAIIMVHNHPSGDTTPSRADIEMTHEVARAAEALGLSLHDHVIVGKSGATSLKSQGLM